MSFADDLEDFFKKLSEHWTDLIRAIYKNKGLTDELIYEPIVKEQAERFSQAIEQAFDASGYDTPDLKMREFLKKNVWEFSVAKNYNDNIALNNLLLKSDGSLRNWSEFKQEAQKVVGKSIRYLKTEYNTIVLGAQNASLWADIQKYKHLFPYLQFSVVMDGHTSEVCKPLDRVIVSVDDPMLGHYFPPNHFNCRTTVRQLRKGTPTENYAVPDIPEAFKNNVGMTGKIFTPKNKYVANTPKPVLILAMGFYKKNEASNPKNVNQFRTLFESENGGKVLEHFLCEKGDDYQSVLASAKWFAKQGKKVTVLPRFNSPLKSEVYKQLFAELEGTPYWGKCPDFKVGNSFYEHEGCSSNNGSKATQKMLSRGLKQSDKIVIEKTNITDKQLHKLIKFRISEGQQISEVWILEGDELKKFYP